MSDHATDAAIMPAPTSDAASELRLLKLWAMDSYDRVFAAQHMNEHRQRALLEAYDAFAFLIASRLEKLRTEGAKP